MRKLTTSPAATMAVAVILGSVGAAVPAYAGGGNVIERSGACAANSSWTMKAKPDHRMIELEFSVETLRAGQAWAVRVTDNGRHVYSGKRITNRVSRSFSVDRMVAGRAGTDRLVAWAKNARTGEVCRGRVAVSGGGGETPG